MSNQIMERYGKLEDMDRSFDLSFWQAQPEAARFAAAWDMVVTAWKIQGKNPDELRLQRTVESFQRLPS